MPRELLSDNVRDFTEEQSSMEFDDMSDVVREEFLARAREMILVREQKARLEKQEAGLKKDLMGDLVRYGEPYGPDGRHRSIQFMEPIRGIARFVRQTKSKASVDEVAAEGIARRKNLYDRLFKQVMALDEGAVMVAVAEGLITDEELAEMFPKKVMYAFTVE